MAMTKNEQRLTEELAEARASHGKTLLLLHKALFESEQKLHTETLVPITISASKLNAIASGTVTPSAGDSIWIAQELIRHQKQLANCVTDRMGLLLQLGETPEGAPGRAEARKALGWVE